MDNREITIGLDCGATNTKVRIYHHNQITFEKNDFPGINMDLDTPTSFDFLSLLRQYPQANWIIALAGLDSEEEREEAFQKWRQLLPSQEIKVISDIELVLWAGSGRGEGIALIAGTGSNCLGRNSLGNTYKVGGISHLLSDEGSGYDLGLQILHQITKMADGRLPKTELLDQVLKLYQQKDLIDLKNYLLNHPHQKAEIARCAILILDTPGPLIDTATSELALMVQTVNQKLKTNNQEPITNNSPVFLAGSLFKSDVYFNLFVSKLPEFLITKVDPLDGILQYSSQHSL